MSLVGTRPPTVDEWEQYELHHRSRMSTKPGIQKLFSREVTEHEEYYNKYRSDSIWYGFSEESCNETIQEEISQTKDKLKM